MNTEACEVYLVRHGETDWNALGRLQGHTDIPLNACGLQQAFDLNQTFAHVKFKAAFSSDLSRAKETARCIIAPRSVPVFETPDLRERYAGSMEGQSVKEIDKWIKKFFLLHPEMSQEDYLNSSWHPEVETTTSVFQRVRNYLVSYTKNYSGQTILVVSHGGVIRAILDHLKFIPKNKWIISNCGFIKLKITPHLFSLEDVCGVIPKTII